MRFVDQTVFTVPGGNCFSACVASLLNLPLEEAPYFMGDSADDEKWWDRLADWLDRFGLTPFCYPISSESIPPNDFYILSGKSPRGDFLHSVIAFGKDQIIIHDPHPSRVGLETFVDYIFFQPKLK